VVVCVVVPEIVGAAVLSGADLTYFSALDAKRGLRIDDRRGVLLDERQVAGRDGEARLPRQNCRSFQPSWLRGLFQRLTRC
jgi:hypothetical protein